MQYMYELDMPANMLRIVKKLPYKLRDRWRTTACEIHERRNQWATFNDIVQFIERQMRMLADPVFSDIQDSSPALNKGMTRPTIKPKSGPKGSSFATSVTSVESHSNITTKGRKVDTAAPVKKVCLCCEGGHILDLCPRLEEWAHSEKIAFLKENGACFACLCVGHKSKDCRKRLSCKVCSMKHPTILHIHSKEKESNQIKKG